MDTPMRAGSWSLLMGCVLALAACQPTTPPASKATERAADPQVEQKAKLEQLRRAAERAGAEVERLDRESTDLLVEEALAAADSSEAAADHADAVASGATSVAIDKAQAASDAAMKRSDEVSAKSAQVKRELETATAQARVAYDELDRAEAAHGSAAGINSSSGRWKQVYKGEGMIMQIDQQSIVRDQAKGLVTIWGRATFGELQGDERVAKMMFNRRFNCANRTYAVGSSISYNESGVVVGRNNRTSYGPETAVAPESADEAMLEALCAPPK